MPGLEANLINLGGISFSGLKVEVNVGSSAKRPASQLQLPFRAPAFAPSPLGLLSWHIRASKFVGREPETTALLDWCNHPSPLAVKFVQGPAGVGKSRFAAELAAQLRTSGWNAGFLDLSADVQVSTPDTRQLIIIDYPEEFDETFQNLVTQLAAAEIPGKIRVLALCRTIPASCLRWLADARFADFCDPRPTVLGNLASEAAKRLYDTSCEAISEHLDTVPMPVSPELFEEWLAADESHGTPLYLVAAAAHACLNPSDIFVRFTGREVVVALVHREQGRLRRLSTAAGLAPECLARALAVAVIQDGFRRSALGALDHLSGFKALGPCWEILESVGEASGDGVRLSAPDLVAACFLSEVLTASDDRTELVWAAKSSRPRPLEQTERLAADATVVLRRRSGLIEAILGCLDNPGRLTSYLYAIAPRRSERVDPVMLPVVEKMWRRRADQEKPFYRSCCLNNVGQALADQGRHDEALRILDRAVKLQKNCRGLSGDEYDREMATKLLNMGRSYFDVGKPWRAAQVLQEAVKLHRPLVEERGLDPMQPSLVWADRSQLWMIYGNLGRALSQAKLAEQATAAFESGLQLIEESRAAFPGLMTQQDFSLLTNYALHLSQLGSKREALALIRRSEAELRARQRDNLTPHGSLVAVSVNMLEFLLSAHEDGSAPLSVTELEELEARANETVDLAERLVSVVPGHKELLSFSQYHKARLSKHLEASEAGDGAPREVTPPV